MVLETAADNRALSARVLFRDYAWLAVAMTGAALMAAGIFALALAATVNLLPYDVQYLGMTVLELCQHSACRIVHFMTHDRVSFGGSIIATGAVYLWLASVPLRKGEAWAWWALLLSGLAGFASFLSYLGYGYLDYWHGRATLALLPLFVVGMIGTYTTLREPRGIVSLRQAGMKVPVCTRAGLGRMCLLFAGAGMMAGGTTILILGMTSVFVPQDLEYMRISVSQLREINPRLVSLIAHDRAGFGGGICSSGIAVLCCVWCGLRPGARVLWKTLLFAGLAGFGTAIGIHPVVGYTTFSHLLPAYLGALAFLAGIVLIRPQVIRGDSSDISNEQQRGTNRVERELSQMNR